MRNSTKGDNPDLKKKRVSYFFMLSPSMKFQNHILNFERTHGRTDARTDARTSPKQYAPSTFSKFGAKKLEDKSIQKSVQNKPACKELTGCVNETLDTKINAHCSTALCHMTIQMSNTPIYSHQSLPYL